MNSWQAIGNGISNNKRIPTFTFRIRIPPQLMLNTIILYPYICIHIYIYTYEVRLDQVSFTLVRLTLHVCLVIIL